MRITMYIIVFMQSTILDHTKTTAIRDTLRGTERQRLPLTQRSHVGGSGRVSHRRQPCSRPHERAVGCLLQRVAMRGAYQAGVMEIILVRETLGAKVTSENGIM